jgi:hypothetical protein
MRYHLAVSCFALALSGGCARSAPPPARPMGLMSVQTVPASLDDRARAALIGAQREQVRLENLHDAADDEVLRGALKWQIDALEARIDALLDDAMPTRPAAVRARLVRSDMVAVQREADRAKNTASWAQWEIEPRKGNAERMPPSPAP